MAQLQTQPPLLPRGVRAAWVGPISLRRRRSAPGARSASEAHRAALRSLPRGAASWPAHGVRELETAGRKHAGALDAIVDAIMRCSDCTALMSGGWCRGAKLAGAEQACAEVCVSELLRPCRAARWQSSSLLVVGVAMPAQERQARLITRRALRVVLRWHNVNSGFEQSECAPRTGSKQDASPTPTVRSSCMLLAVRGRLA